MPPAGCLMLDFGLLTVPFNWIFQVTLSELLNTTFFHWSPEKALWLGEHTLSWDARCAGMYIGFGVGVLYHLLLDGRANRLPPLPILLAVSLLFLPLFLDVFTIMYGVRTPSNDVRFLTGLLFGQALSVYLYPTFITIVVRRGLERAVLASFYRLAALTVITSGAFLGMSLDNNAAYYVYESLGVLGNASLFIIIAYGASKSFGRTANVKGNLSN
jgi:uncharacterized membrane protein